MGYDVKKHKRPELSKLEDNTQIPTDRMATNTTMMVKIQLHDLARCTYVAGVFTKRA